jgi:hypothetical protein
MPRHIQAIDNITGKPHPHGISIEGKPDTCPRCHQGIAAKETSVATLNGDPLAQGTVLEVVYQCPLQRCAKLFVAAYRRSFTLGRPTSGDVFHLIGVLPRTPKDAAVSSEVSEVSPTFTLIYNQAVAAEHHGLDQIAGVGLRKALEFLIKDYCIHLKPEDADAVRKEFLGRTIQNRVTDAKVKAVAERATWLGNDETHYERRWIDKDISDLKTLIELTMAWVRSDVLTNRYLAAMPLGK